MRPLFPRLFNAPAGLQFRFLDALHWLDQLSRAAVVPLFFWLAATALGLRIHVARLIAF